MMQMLVRKKGVPTLITLCVVVISIVRGASIGHAQNGPPSNRAQSFSAATTITTLPSGAQVAVVQGLATGLGSGGCQNTTALQVEQTTIRLMGYGIHTITEITPQSGCDSNINDWINLIASVTDYIKTHTSAAIFPYYWYGIMLDEEDGFWSGGGVKAFEELNESTSHFMAHTPGVAWFYTEDFASTGSWSQNQYNDIIHNDGASIPAPQIYNNRDC